MKLNIGCGKKYDPNYVNIDFQERLVADKIMSAIDLDFNDNSCEEIKAIHLIEHLSFFESHFALSEFFRVLDFDGKLIIETPDIESAFKNYLNSNYEKQKEILGWVFGVPDPGLQHKLCYPLEMLLDLLEKTGFEYIGKNVFYNAESIPTLRIISKKPSKGEIEERFHLLTLIRKHMIRKEYVHFVDSYIDKEQEDLLTYILAKFHEFEKCNDRGFLIDIISKTLIKSPEITEAFLKAIQNYEFISELESKNIFEITEKLRELNFPNILINSLMEVPIIPGSQRLAIFSIESFGEKIIEKIIFSKNEREKELNHLQELSGKSQNIEGNFFSSLLVKKKSEDHFYKGIKFFYLKNFKKSHNNLLLALKLYRDNFLYFWNFAKVLAKLNQKQNALNFYKKSLRLLRITKLENKIKIRNDLKQEIKSFKNDSQVRELNPIFSLDKYVLKNKNI